MAGLSYGFYDSVRGDRKYSSIDFSKLFNGIIRDGVFATEGSMLAVVALPNDNENNMCVGVQPGRAWFDGTWTDVSLVQILNVDTAPVYASRIDTVVLEVNKTAAVRANSFKVIKGDFAQNPVPKTLPVDGAGNPITDPDVHQYPLAYITVAAGTTQLTDSMIINNVVLGSLGVLTSITASDEQAYPMRVYVEAGNAWLGNTWKFIRQRVALTVGPADAQLHRIDTVAYQEIIDSETVSSTSVVIVPGTPAASNPQPAALSNTSTLKQYAIGYIQVNAGTEDITQSMISMATISSSTNYVPTSTVTGILEVADISKFFQTWDNQFHDWEESQKSDFVNWYNTIVEILKAPLDAAVRDLAYRTTRTDDIEFAANNSWTKVPNEDKFTQFVSVSDVKSTDRPIIVYQVHDDMGDFDDYLELCAHCSFETGENKITATYYGDTAPTKKLKFVVKGR